MRHYDTSCGTMSCVPMRKDGVPNVNKQPDWKWHAYTEGMRMV